jgi:hypothetical protein
VAVITFDLMDGLGGFHFVQHTLEVELPQQRGNAAFEELGKK